MSSVREALTRMAPLDVAMFEWCTFATTATSSPNRNAPKSDISVPAR